MIEVLKSAIEILAKKITAQTSPDEALKYTQAALNLAHTIGSIAVTPPIQEGDQKTE